jgi:hypothetical protein
MHIMKKHITLHKTNTTIKINKPEYTYIHVCVLGSQPHSVIFVVVLLAEMMS